MYVYALTKATLRTFGFSIFRRGCRDRLLVYCMDGETELRIDFEIQPLKTGIQQAISVTQNARYELKRTHSFGYSIFVLYD